MLSQDERNHAVRVDAQTEEKPVTEDFLGKTEPRDYTPEYQLLDRLRMDCEYFLGAGQHSEKHLWAGNRHAQIAKMRELYEMIPDKPEWLTPEMINSYEERMAPRYLVAAYHHFENGFDDKLDYYTLEEAEKAAQGYVDGTMEDDGFKYDGAAVYDQQEHKCIRIYGDYPDEKAHAQVRASAEPEQQEPEHFIDHFYVAEDIQKRGALDIKEYSSFDDALRAYYALPDTQRKALGAMNTRDLPGSLDFVQCVDGKDTIIQDYAQVDGWQNAEVMDIIAQLEQSITTREIPPVPAVNFHITDDNIGEGGPKQKFARNIAAIETLFKLESENRNATTEEQEILSNYVGWGGLADAFDPDKGNWAKEYQTLKNLLSEDEYAAARASTLNAHYTSPKRLGLSQKSLFVVPNHLTLQWANEFLHLYPSAKLLVATKKDFETANRKKFCARIATGDYDAVIIGHSQFEKIPLSAERQERQLREQIDEIEGAIAELKWQRGENFTIKQMEKTRKSLEARLDKLLAADKKDDVITFEQLGVDRLFVDESHAFKNLFLYTKMRNVAGLSTSEAQKSSDMFMKCRYMDELTGGRGVIFATGTPVSNSMTELYTVMRYLQYSTLQQKNLTHFDSWASTFGETTTAIELAPEGTGYRARTRFAKFFNLPELMNMFKEVADIKTSDQLHLPVPEAKFETVVVQPSEYQKDMVASLSERAADVHAGIVDPSVDNMLKITSDGRKLGLDQRLMNTLLPDDPDSKLNACVGNILRIWQDGQADKLTQLVFCDLIISHHEKLHSDIYLHLQRPPKIERLANFEPIGRCKIPLN
ncbi:hypothetical protein LIR33_07780 [Flavonifractor plautii]|nr:hypothetical protein [Flavonifractor plautii]